MNNLLQTLILTVCASLIIGVNTSKAQLYDFAQDVIDEIGVTDPNAQIALAATMEVAGINNNNWIVGHFTETGNIRRVFVWVPPTVTELPSGDTVSTPPQVQLLASGNELEAVGISDNGTVIYNTIETIIDSNGDPQQAIVGYVSRYEVNTSTYQPGVGTTNLQMKAISHNWIAADFHIKDDSFFDPFSSCPLFAFVGQNPFIPILASGFQLQNFTRAMALNLDGDMTIGPDKQIAFFEALACNLPSRAYSIKASSNGDLQYVGGESYGRGQGEEKYTNAHAFVYSNENGSFFQTTEVIGGVPGQVRAVNSIGEIAGTWFTPNLSDDPNSLRGFRSIVVGCPTDDGESLPFIDLIPDANVLPNSINEGGFVVGTYNLGEASAFIYTNTLCEDPTPIPSLDSPRRFDPNNTDLSFKDLTIHAKKEVGILGWQKLSTAQAINDNDWVVGRGLDPNGDQRPYLLSFPLCDKVPRQGLTGKGDYEMCDANYFSMPLDIMTSLRERLFNSTRVTDRPRVVDFKGDQKIFFDNARNRGWFVDQVALNGPGNFGSTEPVDLATNIGAFYENNARLEIISDQVLIPAGDPQNIFTDVTCSDCTEIEAPTVNYTYEETYLRFKVFSQLENVYDRVSIDIRINPAIGTPTDWITCATIAHSYDDLEDYAFQDPLFPERGETADDGWADYMVDLSKYAGHRVQFRIRFNSDRCNVGGGVQMKDFQLIQIRNDFQALLFEDFMGEAFLETGLELVIDVLLDIILDELFESNKSTAGRVDFTGTLDPVELAKQLQQLKGVKAGKNVSQLLDAMRKAKIAAGAGGTAKLGLGAIVGQGLIATAGLGLSFAVAAAEAADQVQLYAVFDGLDPYSAGKRRVLLNGMSQLTANPTNLEKLTMQVLTANAMHQVDPLNPTSERYGIESFVDVNSKKIKVIIPTETDLMLDINNSRLMFKRYFAELAMISNDLSMDVYVYNTFSRQFYEISVNNADFLNAFERVDYALDVAHKYWEAKACTLAQWPPLIRRNDRSLANPATFFNLGKSVIEVLSPEPSTKVADQDIPANCFIMDNGGNDGQLLLCSDLFVALHDPDDDDLIEEIQDSPEPIQEALELPQAELQEEHAPARTRTATEVCGTMALYMGISGSVTPSGSIQSTSRDSEDRDYVHILPTAVRPDQINGPDRAPNIEGNSQQPDALDKASAFDDDVNTASEENVIVSPEANYYLDGTPFELEINTEYAFVYGSYRKELEDEEQARLGIKRNKSIAFFDLSDVRIDNIVFEGAELLPSVISPFVTIPQDGRYEVDVCVIGDDGDLIEEQTNYHILSSLLHRVRKIDGTQQVVFDFEEINGDNNLAIFIPGVSRNSFLVDHSAIPFERKFGLADLEYRSTPVPISGVPRLWPGSRWSDYDTYIYQSPAYLEGAQITARPMRSQIMRTVLDRIFATSKPDGVEWYDTYHLEPRDNSFPDVVNNPSPTTGLIDYDEEYLNEVLSSFALEASQFDRPHVIAIYAEDVSAFRMVQAVTNSLLFENLELYPNIRFVLGLLDPVWDPRMNSTIRDLILDLEFKEQVTAFVAHSQQPTLQEEMMGETAATVSLVLEGFVEYDWAFIDDFRIQNENLGSKFVYSLGANANIDLAYCTISNLPNGNLLGITADGKKCYSTTHNDELGNEQTFTGYFGPYCELQRDFFIGGDKLRPTSYRFRGHNFTILDDNEFEIIWEDDPSRTDLIIMELLNPDPDDEEMMQNIVNGN